MSDDLIYGVLCRGLFRVRFFSSAWGGEKLLDDGVGVVHWTGANIACWMDTVLWLSFSLVINVWSLTLMIGKSVTVSGMSLLYVVVVTFSASLTKEVANGGLSVWNSWAGAFAGVLLTFLLWSCLYRLWADVSLVFTCARKALIHARSSACNAWGSVG